MPATKNQLKRLDLIDELLARKKWSNEELLERINFKLEESINKRTLFRDIQYLIEEKDAPIHRPTKADPYYYYTEKFSIKNSLLDLDEVSVLRKSINLLKQAGRFPFLTEAEIALRKLENKLNSDSEDLAVVQFENHTSASGDQWFEELYEAITSKTPLVLAYRPFTAKATAEKIVHPYFLKEYRNRWFLFGRETGYNNISIFALDRIQKCKPAQDDIIENDLFDPKLYFKYVIGVTMPRDSKVREIVIKVKKGQAHYILSKPIHQTQRVIGIQKNGSVLIQLNLVLNYELKSILLSYGSDLVVIKPKELRLDIANEFNASAQNYHL